MTWSLNCPMKMSWSVICLRPGLNVALSSCRTQLYKVRLQRDYSTTVDSNVVLNSGWLVPSRLCETHVSGTESVSEDRLSSDIHWNELCPLYYTMTFSRHKAALPAFRKELEFDFAVDTLEHSKKSDSGLILSCSDDIGFYLRTLNPKLS